MRACDPGGVSDRSPASPGDVLVRVGAVVFGVGALATMVTVIPLFIGADPLPTAAYVVSMLMGVGFAIAAAGLLRSVAHQRRVARAGQTGRTAGAASAR
ncbi:hypothetical protein [Streptomyces litchfieldiae]|uniref:Integral membrane protein n=1 Tax=Streptomyces litchfieldiae TaxID=3075543 RepID=A0ABU2MQT2_9ACTN|nr:hypothetical protein [Streptomyces sp. DSM 44938]MDT0343253.1 hypothetical protein [Streptomyces sp. DSM 44938]